MKPFHYLIQDFREKRNIDIYITLLLAILVSILGTFQVIDQTVISSSVLATLALVAYNLLISRYKNEEIQQVLQTTISSHFNKWDEDVFLTALHTAQEISGFYVTNYPFLNAHSELFKAFLARGGKLRFIYVKRDSSAFSMAILRGYGAEAKDPRHLRNRLSLSLDKLKEISLSASDTSQVQVKFIDFLPSATITLTKTKQLNETAFVTITGFGINSSLRPSFILAKNDEWFDYFKDTFENIWDSEKCEPVDLSQLS